MIAKNKYYNLKAPLSRERRCWNEAMIRRSRVSNKSGSAAAQWVAKGSI